MNSISVSTGKRFENPLPGVPVVESPFFNELMADIEMDDTTRAVAEHLHTHGWAAIDFPDPDFDAVAERIKKSLHDQYDWDHWRKDGWRNNDGLRVQDAYRTNADVQRIAANPQILRLLSTLYGRRAWPFQTLNFPVGTQQHFHSDSVHFSTVPERFMCGVWVALEDIGPTQGPLMYFSGSHKWPVYVNEHVGYSRVGKTTAPSQKPYEALWAELLRVNKLEPTYFHAKKGQAVIWAANLIHGGSRQTDPNSTRWSQVTHYYFDGCSYYSPMLSDPFYGRIFFRMHKDISTGAPVRNMYSGLRVPLPVVGTMTFRSISKRWVMKEMWSKMAARLGR